MKTLQNFAKYLLPAVFLFSVLVAGSGTAEAYIHAVTLRIGSSGPKVIELQVALNASGVVTPTLVADGKFGPKTHNAVRAFQVSRGLSVDGVVGPITGGALATVGVGTIFPPGCTSSSGYSPLTGQPCSGGANLPPGCTSTSGFSTTTGQPCSGGVNLPAGCTSTSGYSPTTGTKCDSNIGNDDDDNDDNDGPLQGGAGSVDSYDLVSGLNNEEVGEDANDIKVAGLEIENSDSSDIEITAVRLVFDEGTATGNFDDYAEEISIWLGDEKVATRDADDFTRNNDWSATISLEDGAIIRSGKTETLYVAVSGATNIDSADIGDTWAVDFRTVRFVDAEGSSLSEDPGTAATSFSFESFAAASDTALKITEGDAAINDSRIIDVDASDDTDDVELLSFKIEVEGDSDITFHSIPVSVTTTETTGNDPDDLISTLYFIADGDEIGSENLSTSDADDGSETVVFEDVDFTIKAGETVTFTVAAKIQSIADQLDAGDTIAVTFGETQTDLATFDVEDESGQELADADKTGSVTGEAHTVYDTGFNFKLISKNAVAQQSGFSADDSGIFTFVFDLTAFGGPVNIDKSCEEGGADAADQGIEYIISNAANNATSCTFDSTADTSVADADAWTIQENQTERFTLTVSAGTLDAGQQIDKVYLESINWDDDITDTSPDLFYTAGLGSDKTSTSTILLVGV